VLLEPALELGLDALGLVLEPEAALPDVLPELAPPLAWSFLSVDIDAEPDAEPDGEVELDGDDGEVVEPADDEAEPDGEAVEPDGEVLRAGALSARSHAATRAVPRATETASARVLNLMKASLVGDT
jgi:hypothetical protein